MTLKDWADLAQLTLIPAILVSLLGLWYNMHDNRKRAREFRNGEWQKVVIYSMLDTMPLTMDEIRRDLVARATAFGLRELGLERIRDISIRAAILDLISHHAIMRIPPEAPNMPERYAPVRVVMADPMEPIRLMNTLRLEQAKQATDVRLLVEQNNGRFTEPELAQFIRQSTKLDNSIADNLSSILSALEVQGLVGRGDNQKLVRLRRISPPVASRPPSGQPTPRSSC